MSAERKDPSRYICLGDPTFDTDKFAEQDFLIRSGMCPNGHGLLQPTDYGQKCQSCGFFTNTSPDKECAQ